MGSECVSPTKSLEKKMILCQLVQVSLISGDLDHYHLYLFQPPWNPILPDPTDPAGIGQERPLSLENVRNPPLGWGSVGPSPEPSNRLGILLDYSVLSHVAGVPRNSHRHRGVADCQAVGSAGGKIKPHRIVSWLEVHQMGRKP